MFAATISLVHKDYCSLSACDVVEMLEKRMPQSDQPGAVSHNNIHNVGQIENGDFRLRMLERRLRAMEQPGIFPLL